MNLAVIESSYALQRGGRVEASDLAVEHSKHV